ncbi:MAG: TIGR03759 family integrating conjugative element protein [Pseudomonadota bacterium]
MSAGEKAGKKGSAQDSTQGFGGLLALLLVFKSGFVVAQTTHVPSTHVPPTHQSADFSESSYAHHIWGLSADDWVRFERVMKNRRGVWSPGLDPITALGVSTDDRGERQRLAELYVRTEYERTRKELAFQIAVDQAWQRLYPKTPRLTAAGGAQAASVPPERYAVVVRPSCAQCDEFINGRVPDLIEEAHHGVDVHVVGTNGDDERLRAWITTQPLIQAALKTDAITINHGGPEIEQAHYPALFRKNGAGQWSRDL